MTKWSGWWRAYDEALYDEKLQWLPADLFKAWFNICCLNSQNGGVLPELKVIAFRLRVSELEATNIMDRLIEADLIDLHADGTMSPHNWNGRQYKSDVSTPRVKKYRDKRRNVSGNVSETADETLDETFPKRKGNRKRNAHETAAREERNVAGNAMASVSVTPPDSDSETDSEQRIDDDGSASARPKSRITAEALSIADELQKIAGIRSRLDVPPSWCGAALQVQTWMDGGWTRDEIITGGTVAMARKRDGSPASVNFFQFEIAKQHARCNTPLPDVKFDPDQKVPPDARDAKTVQSAARDFARQFRKFDEPIDSGGANGIDVGYLSKEGRGG
jgi:hypothetical protein